MNLQDALARAEELLPGQPAQDERLDPRWQAIIQVGEFVSSHPDEVWDFAARWGDSDDEDLRSAIATCILEHLLEHHFDTMFPRVERLVARKPRFAETFRQCWKFGLSREPENAKRFQALQARLPDRA